ncbi:hypothetical protein [Ruegeria conchae]|uniref:hypothetical protein n=1 Tax=Ruegeria conchae TaxID=981384 RepID=UPI000237A2DC|nr:hypothetical protein [Ruegeria conchae]
MPKSADWDAGRLISQILELDVEVTHRPRGKEMAHWLMKVPGIGPHVATALVALSIPNWILH